MSWRQSGQLLSELTDFTSIHYEIDRAHHENSRLWDGNEISCKSSTFREDQLFHESFSEDRNNFFDLFIDITDDQWDENDRKSGRTSHSPISVKIRATPSPSRMSPSRIEITTSVHKCYGGSCEDYLSSEAQKLSAPGRNCCSPSRISRTSFKSSCSLKRDLCQSFHSLSDEGDLSKDSVDNSLCEQSNGILFISKSPTEVAGLQSPPETSCCHFEYSTLNANQISQNQFRYEYEYSQRENFAKYGPHSNLIDEDSPRIISTLLPLEVHPPSINLSSFSIQNDGRRPPLRCNQENETKLIGNPEERKMRPIKKFGGNNNIVSNSSGLTVNNAVKGKRKRQDTEMKIQPAGSLNRFSSLNTLKKLRSDCSSRNEVSDVKDIHNVIQKRVQGCVQSLPFDNELNDFIKKYACESFDRAHSTTAKMNSIQRWGSVSDSSMGLLPSMESIFNGSTKLNEIVLDTMKSLETIMGSYHDPNSKIQEMEEILDFKRNLILFQESWLKFLEKNEMFSATQVFSIENSRHFEVGSDMFRYFLRAIEVFDMGNKQLPKNVYDQELKQFLNQVIMEYYDLKLRMIINVNINVVEQQSIMGGKNEENISTRNPSCSQNPPSKSIMPTLPQQDMDTWNSLSSFDHIDIDIDIDVDLDMI